MSDPGLEMTVDDYGWMSLTTWLLLGVIALFTAWIWQEIRALGVLKSLGIPGPRPIPVVGNILAVTIKGFQQSMREWKEKYGSTYGMYLPMPSLVVNDPEVLKDLCVKKFSSFQNRQPLSVLGYKPINQVLLSLRDDQWKHVRSTLTPTFSSGKLKRVFPAIDRVAKNLAMNIKTKVRTGEIVELKHLCGSFAIDAIAGTTFGIQVDSLNNPNDPFVKHAFLMSDQKPIVLPILIAFPWLIPILRKFDIAFVPDSTVNFLINITDTALKQRKEESKSTVKKYHDFLQLLLEAENENEAQSREEAGNDNGHDLRTSAEWTRKGLTADEVHANAISFFLAGFDTVSTVMAFTLFCLAGEPDCLLKVQAELDAKLGQKSADYVTSAELTYLDMVINEVTRLYPATIISDRQASEDTDLGGYHVPKGMRVIIPFYDLHTDPEYWPDPMKFDPERHTPEARANRHPFCFMPFGLGPRNCIGMRLAQLELRTALATVLQNFSPVLCDKSVYPPIITKYGRMVAEDGLWVKFRSRT